MLTLIGVLSLCTITFAQDSADIPPVEPPAPTETGWEKYDSEDDSEVVEGTTEQAAAKRRALEGDALYQLGLGLMGKQMWAEACATFGRVGDHYADLEVASRALEQQRMIQQIGDPGCGQPAGATTATAPSSSRGQAGSQAIDGKVELMISQAVIGTTLGLLTPSALNISEPILYSAGALAGMAGGLALSSTAIKRHGVTQGQAMALYTGETLGITHGLIVATASFDLMNPIQPILGGLVLGIGGGVGAAIGLKPSAGDMALVRSGISWGAASGLLFMGVGGLASPYLIMGTMDLGLVVGAVVASRIDISRKRMNLINLAGYVGAASTVILWTGIAAGGAGASYPVFVGTILVGGAGGLAVGAMLTRDVDGDSRAANGTALEFRDGKWYAGLPMPEPAPVMNDGDVQFGVRFSLARGRF